MSKEKKNENVPGKRYKNSNNPVQCPTRLFIINLSFLRSTSNAAAAAAIDRRTDDDLKTTKNSGYHFFRIAGTKPLS